jgi:hypothetical protein
MAKVTPSSVKLLLRGKSNPVLLKSLVLSSTNATVLESLVNHLGLKAMKGDVRAKLFLNRCASEKFNKNALSRGLVIGCLSKRASNADYFGLRGLLVGIRDSNPNNRLKAFEGLRIFVSRGNPAGIKSLIIGAKDPVEKIRWQSLAGLYDLARLYGDARALPGLLIGVKDCANNNYLALAGLKELAEQGNIEAKNFFLEELKK